MTTFLLSLLLCLIPHVAWSQGNTTLGELPDVDGAILATELLQTESRELAEGMMKELGYKRKYHDGKETVFSLVAGGRGQVIRVEWKRHAPNPAQLVSFTASPSSGQLLREAMLRVGYLCVTTEEQQAEFRHNRLGIHATIAFDPIWDTSSLVFSLADQEGDRHAKTKNLRKVKQ